MGSTIKSTTTSTTKKVAGKTIKTVVDETTVIATSEVISLDKQKKKVEIIRGVMADESRQLMQQFFKAKRS